MRCYKSGKQHKFAVLKIKSYVSKNKVIFFDFIGHKNIALLITLKIIPLIISDAVRNSAIAYPFISIFYGKVCGPHSGSESGLRKLKKTLLRQL